MMLSNITKDNIYDILKNLAKEIRKELGKDAKVEIVLVGGGSILLNYNFRQATRDLDVIIQSEGSIKEAIKRAGEDMGLEDGWINTDFIYTKSYSDILRNVSTPVFEYNNKSFVVRSVTASDLIAMKLTSGREYKNDISDIVGIIKEEKEKGNDICWKDIHDSIIKIYKDDKDISIEHIGYVQFCLTLTPEQLEIEYNERKDLENKIKDELLNIENIKMEALTEDNIEDIIAQIKNNMPEQDKSEINIYER